MIITKSILKFVKSLQLKKNRIEHQCFLVEGTKSVQELLTSDFTVEMIVGSNTFLEANKELVKQVTTYEAKINDISANSSYKNNNSVIAIAKMSSLAILEIDSDEYVLVLDDVRDPGNLGTIIRIADWYGVNKILASPTTADFYNPKVISASMGSFARVKMYREDVTSALKSYDGEIYGAMMNGVSLHEVPFKKGGVIVMGNESTGISSEIQELLTTKVTIPRYGQAESLNVGIATAVICDRIRSR